MTFQAELAAGQRTMADKVERLKVAVIHLAERLGLDKEFKDQLIEIAKIAKADLASSMVFEFPELQGLVGGFIAEQQGADPLISEAISAQYDSFDEKGKEYFNSSLIFSLLDRADNIVSLFSIEKIPTGSADPFALRRQAQEIARTMMHLEDGDLTIKDLIDISYQSLIGDNNFEEFFNKIHKKKFSLADYLAERARAILRAEPIGMTLDNDPDYLNALPNNMLIENNLALVCRIIYEFKEYYRKEPSSLSAILQSLKRIANILKDHNETEYKKSNLTEQVEKDLDQAFTIWQSSEQSWADAYALSQPIEAFFEGVLVNDAPHRKNLLAAIKQSFDQRFLSPDWKQLS